MLSSRIAWRFLRSSPVQSGLIIGGIAVGIAVQIFVGSLITSLQASLVDQTIGSAPQITIKAVNDGELNYVDGVREYGEKAHIMKRMFTDNGFRIVYDMDLDAPIADGFYFTFAYPGLTGEALLRELMYYGVSAIALETTGSGRTEGLRACTSLIQRSEFPLLNERLAWFHRDHKGAAGTAA